jgi:hypothetical protein
MRFALIRLGALAAGALMFCIAFLINIIGASALANSLYMEGPDWIDSDINWPLVVGYDQLHAIFLWSYPAIVAIATITVFWNGRPSELKRTMLYLLLLAVVGPLTFINYLQSDQWLNLWVQTGFNLFVAFAGYVVVLHLQRIKSKAADVMALQSLAIFGITALLIALPLFYSTIFLSTALGFLDHKQIVAIGEKAPLVLASGLGGVVAFLGHLANLRRPGDDPAPAEPRRSSPVE